MIEFCIACNKKITDYNWKNKGTGWICSKHFKTSYIEFAPQNLKESRKEYAKSQLQPYRDGQLSREFIDTYGTKRISATEKEIKNARPVWSDILPSNWQGTK